MPSGTPYLFTGVQLENFARNIALLNKVIRLIFDSVSFLLLRLKNKG